MIRGRARPNSGLNDERRLSGGGDLFIKAFRVQNFRRLKDVRIDLGPDRTIFVGANNSGKTSATHVFQLFLGHHGHRGFQVYDFTADCWADFDAFDPASDDAEADLPRIIFDLWFEVGFEEVHRVLDLLPGLDWAGEPVGIRMEYAPRDGAALVANYEAARASADSDGGGEANGYTPWPRSMLDYLTRRLGDEYGIRYSVLDANRCNEDLRPHDGYEPHRLPAATGAKTLQSIVRVDFMHAQRHLTDADSGGRGQDLSRRLNRYYERNLEKPSVDVAALTAIADAEERLDAHLAEVFESVLDHLGTVGYPGIGNPDLEVRSSLDRRGLLASGASVHYRLPGAGEDAPTLPDRYNGLGFKNLIYMVVEVLDFHQAWLDAAEDRPPIHLVIVEEPEAHLHAPPQQVFVKKIRDALGPPEVGFETQLVVTTHSPHITYDSDFTPIRYFCRTTTDDGLHLSEVKDLSRFLPTGGVASLNFLRQYIKLTHCDLFFADAAVLVEGNVERLLLPLIIERCASGLTSNHLAILEVGGAFAHRFAELVTFLSIPTLVVTDLDSVVASPDGGHAAACMVEAEGATTSNHTLRTWIPQVEAIADLLSVGPDAKAPVRDDGRPGLVRVAYQTRRSVSWAGETAPRAGRTFEEAFALENLDWTQDGAGSHVGLAIDGAADLSLEQLHKSIYEKVKTFDKTSFALNVIASGAAEWIAPHYIVEGLRWLEGMLASVLAEVEPGNQGAGGGE